jgi:hypothetical protein
MQKYRLGGKGECRFLKLLGFTLLPKSAWCQSHYAIHDWWCEKITVALCGWSRGTGERNIWVG